MSEQPKNKRLKKMEDNGEAVIVQAIESVASSNGANSFETVIESKVDEVAKYREGPMLQSFRLLDKAYKEIKSQLHKEYVTKILNTPMELNSRIFVFIDLDWAMHQDGYLRREVQEIATLYASLDYNVYAVTSKSLEELQLNDHTGFTSILYHPAGNDIVKAYSFQNIIRNDVPAEHRTLMIFAGPLLIANLTGFYDSSLDLIIDISYDEDDEEQETEEVSTETKFKQRPKLNVKAAWRLEDYSIMEYILYYIAIHVTIRVFKSYEIPSP